MIRGFSTAAAVLLTLVGALLVATGPARAETFVNRWTQVQIGVQGGQPLAAQGVPGTDWIIEQAGDGFVRLKDSASGGYLNVEKGLAVGPVGPGWWSAMWTLEQAGGGFVRIKNRWTGVYLNVETGALEATPAQPGWWSAQWQVGGAGQSAAAAPTTQKPTTTAASKPAAGATPEQACIDRLMKPTKGNEVRWGLGAKQFNWTQPNADALCGGTPDAELPLGCFQAAIALGAPWQQAIQWCRYEFSSCDYAAYDGNGGQWTPAVAGCHFGGNAEAADTQMQKAGTKCTAKAVTLRKGGTFVDQDQAATLCEGRDAVIFPADCLASAIGGELSIDQGVLLCRNTLSNVMTISCYGLGKAAGASTEQAIEVCRLQDDHLSGVTQQKDTYGRGMRDSCVRRNVGLQQGKTDLAAGWNACKGKILY